MRTAGHSSLRRGFFLLEVAASILLLGVMAGLTAVAVYRHGQTRMVYARTQRVAWAADAQLQRIQAGAGLESLPPPGVLAEKVTLVTTSEPGRGDWDGFTLVTVTATAPVKRGKVARARSRGYVRTEREP